MLSHSRFTKPFAGSFLDGNLKRTVSKTFAGDCSGDRSLLLLPAQPSPHHSASECSFMLSRPLYYVLYSRLQGAVYMAF